MRRWLIAAASVAAVVALALSADPAQAGRVRLDPVAKTAAVTNGPTAPIPEPIGAATFVLGVGIVAWAGRRSHR
jgi:hypothetical protein